MNEYTEITKQIKNYEQSIELLEIKRDSIDDEISVVQSRIDRLRLRAYDLEKLGQDLLYIDQPPRLATDHPDFDEIRDQALTKFFTNLDDINNV